MRPLSQQFQVARTENIAPSTAGKRIDHEAFGVAVGHPCAHPIRLGLARTGRYDVTLQVAARPQRRAVPFTWWRLIPSERPEVLLIR
jgi:hypothetical protein